MLRIIYMGTPWFAVPALEALIKGRKPGVILPEGYEIAAVITRPDKPTGRGRGIVYSPVKQTAMAYDIPIWQPGSFKKAENAEALAAYQADLYVVAAFGQILPQKVLDQPRYGTLNIHASLLPRYRGPDPIAEAIMQGDAESGVTIMLLDAGIDTGPMLFKRRLALAKDETTGSLTQRLSDLGALALTEMLPEWIAGSIAPEPQNEELASHTRMLKKEDGEMDFSLGAAALERKIRAYSPWPSAYTYWQGRLLKLVQAQPIPFEADGDVQPGQVILHRDTGEDRLTIVTGSGLLDILQLQLEGKRAMSSADFLRGYGRIVGSVLGKQV
jgi:methionyl-tRNA formyltransferase